MILYHGTKSDVKRKILKQGFIKSFGEYGNGIYFATTKEFAHEYGDKIIEVFIDDEYITTLTQEDICNIGITNDIENYAYKNNISAIMIAHNKNQIEVCVYGDWIIEILK